MKFSLDKIKNQQRVLFWGLIGLVSFTIIVVVILFVSQTDGTQSPKKSYRNSLTTATNRMTPQEVYMENSRIEYELQRKRLDSVENMLKQLVKMNEERQNIPESSENISSSSIGSVADLKRDIQQSFLPPQPQGGSSISGPGIMPVSQGEQEVSSFRSNGINKTNINLVNSRRDKPLKTVDNYIPAGSFAPAVVLEGVDASTSVHAQGDPRPITLQVTEDAYLPSNHRSRLKGCFITAAAAGDMSSERAYVRLEKLSCVEKK
ncbi:MAG: TraB/VirB10 family protein, partial [Chlamydiales bacterium]|nr:TraB/VirB10 family protein [Chlamydiales bacterium]